VTFSHFDEKGREKYADEMREYGYVEFDDYTSSDRQYCCGNCPAMKKKGSSPTGYWCERISVPDKPNGCCDRWTPK